ncbi:MAG: Phosphoglycolate phosphatase [Firmicutes bacterium ADurb.Bin193]|nr:MAG: Phosphoglycolate phosphatase [Firmicutes bacterium ADurb.Bin193]
MVRIKYNTFIFDFDYTLADSTVGIAKSINYALEKLGLAPKNTDEIRKTIGMTLKETFRILTGIESDSVSSDFIHYFMEKADEVMVDNTDLFSDTVLILEQLKNEGFKTAIVTTKVSYRIVEVLEKNRSRHLIDYIVGFEDVREAKPAAEGLLKAVKALNSEKEKVLYIGDSLIDAKTAQNAGIDFAAVTTGTTAAQDFKQFPHILIADSLTNLFAGLRAR